ncbi:MAG: hypothetical protein ABFR62_13665 [Bacteroidota bacterium]
MKKVFSIGILLGLVLITNSCQDKITDTYTVNEPEYMTYDDLRSSFKVIAPTTIKRAGKIYFKDDYIFINEYQEGIHILNNSDPSNPHEVSFIEIPGNVDMAIKGDKLYADSYIDLLTIDISNMNNIVEIDRDTSVFPYIIPEVEEGIVSDIDDSRGVITGYAITQKTEEVEDHSNYYQTFDRWGGIEAVNDAPVFDGALASTGKGGSMARFTLYDNYLYAIDNASLNLFDISNLSNPELYKRIPISWQIETLFPYEQKLFIGSQSGMFIYSLQNPANPQFISEFRHASACDPVVVEGDYAYVTLRGGNLCGAIDSQLDVIDISLIENPKLVTSYPMDSPYGLGIDDQILFVCDGDSGLKIYDAGDPLAISDNKIAQYSDINAYDVIPLGNVLLMIGSDGFYQYDYSDLSNIKLLSHIAVEGE